MVNGLDVFRSYFSAFPDQYVLIGGAACDLLFEEAATPFRATRDLDMVLIAEALTPAFAKRFWEFVHDGKYQRRARSTGKPQFYRFDKPETPGFPYMIELFSRRIAALDAPAGQTLAPLHISDEVSSLSAILLNEDYYRMLGHGKTVTSDIPILSGLYLIPFKAKAWLDLTQRRQSGQHIDERDIRKHKNDVLRLSALLSGTESCALPDAVREDMAAFTEQLGHSPVDMKALHLGNLKVSGVTAMLRSVYRL